MKPEYEILLIETQSVNAPLLAYKSRLDNLLQNPQWYPNTQWNNPNLAKAHAVIVSDEPIKLGDYHIDMDLRETMPDKAIAYTDTEQLEAIKSIGGAKRIIASTDPALPVNRIPTDWLKEIYIPNPGLTVCLKSEVPSYQDWLDSGGEAQPIRPQIQSDSVVPVPRYQTDTIQLADRESIIIKDNRTDAVVSNWSIRDFDHSLKLAEITCDALNQSECQNL